MNPLMMPVNGVWCQCVWCGVVDKGLIIIKCCLLSGASREKNFRKSKKCLMTPREKGKSRKNKWKRMRNINFNAITQRGASKRKRERGGKQRNNRKWRMKRISRNGRKCLNDMNILSCLCPMAYAGNFQLLLPGVAAFIVLVPVVVLVVAVQITQSGNGWVNALPLCHAELNYADSVGKRSGGNLFCCDFNDFKFIYNFIKVFKLQRKF